MRGHKLSLVWLGHSISSLRAIRSSSIGAERALRGDLGTAATHVQEAMVTMAELDAKHRPMICRYSVDLLAMMVQIKRVMKNDARAILVVGNSCLKSAFIKNSKGVTQAAIAAGLRLTGEEIRELPPGNRYLPTPRSGASALGKRMRTESILTFKHVPA